MSDRVGSDASVDEGWSETGPEPSWNDGRCDDDDAVVVAAEAEEGGAASSSTATFGYSAAVSAALTTQASLACLFQGAPGSSAQKKIAVEEEEEEREDDDDELGSTNLASASIDANCCLMSRSVSRHCSDSERREATAAPPARAARDTSALFLLPPSDFLDAAAALPVAVAVAVADATADAHASYAATHTRWSDCCPAAIEGTIGGDGEAPGEAVE